MSHKCVLIAAMLSALGISLSACDRHPRPPDSTAPTKTIDERIEHERRLRDADRLRLERQLQAVEQQRAVLIGTGVGLSLAALVAAIWLGVEIRRRRALAQLLVHFQSTTSKEVNHVPQ